MNLKVKEFIQMLNDVNSELLEKEIEDIHIKKERPYNTIKIVLKIKDNSSLENIWE